MLIGEWFGQLPNRKGYFVYWVKIRKNNRNYYKIGTTTNPKQRFSSKDYKDCQSIAYLYFAEFDNEYEMMNFEELNKSWLREQLTQRRMKGMRWIANDRFTYNHKVDKLPIIYRFNKVKFLEI